jgi:hypothetical protein
MTDAGNFPRDLQPDARRFAALTKLQYERFEAWKEDDAFYLMDNDTPPTPPSKLEDIRTQGGTAKGTYARYPGVDDWRPALPWNRHVLDREIAKRQWVLVLGDTLF